MHCFIMVPSFLLSFLVLSGGGYCFFLFFVFVFDELCNLFH